MEQTCALTLLNTRANARLRKSAVLMPAVAALLTLTGCQSSARQDVFTTHGSTCAYMMPTVSGTRTYPSAANNLSDAEKAKLPPNSMAAYPDPETPAYCDRPLSENLLTSIELADYTRGLQDTNLLKFLQREGPYTVFAVPNSALETYSSQTGGTLMAPQNRPALRQLLSYTIIKGKWSFKKLKAAVKASPTHTVKLNTLNGMPLLVTNEVSATPQIIISNGAGSSSRLWVTGIPQSNGVLYFTQSLVTPPPAPIAAAKPAASVKQQKSVKKQNARPSAPQKVTPPATTAQVNTQSAAHSTSSAVTAPQNKTSAAVSTSVSTQNTALPATPSTNAQSVMLPSSSSSENVQSVALPATAQKQTTSATATKAQPLPGHRSSEKSQKNLSAPPDLVLP